MKWTGFYKYPTRILYKLNIWTKILRLYLIHNTKIFVFTNIIFLLSLLTNLKKKLLTAFFIDTWSRLWFDLGPNPMTTHRLGVMKFSFLAVFVSLMNLLCVCRTRHVLWIFETFILWVFRVLRRTLESFNPLKLSLKPCHQHVKLVFNSSFAFNLTLDFNPSFA